MTWAILGTSAVHWTEAIAAFYLALIIREFGRLLACKLIGWDVYLLRILPVLVRFEPFAVRLGGIPGRPWAGTVLAFPPTPEKQSKWRVAVFNLSGAAADLIGAVAAVVGLVTAPRYPFLLVFFFLLIIGFLWVGWTSLAEFQKNKPLSRFGIALWRALGLRASGTMPGELDSALIETLETGADAGAVETDADRRRADIYLYEHYLDLGNDKKAREALDRAISRTEPSDERWDGLCIENAFFSAFIERNIPLAEASLAKVEDADRRKFYAYTRALAAIAIARGDGAEALRLLRGGYRSRYPFSEDFTRRIHERVVRAAQQLVSR